MCVLFAQSFLVSFLSLVCFSILSAGQLILIKVHAYLKPGMLVNSTSIDLNCATLPTTPFLSPQSLRGRIDRYMK